MHGNAGITEKRVFVAGSGIGDLVLASAMLGAKSAIGIESKDQIFDAATKFHNARKCLCLQNVCNLGSTSFAQMHSFPHDPSVLFAFMKNISLEEWVSMPSSGSPARRRRGQSLSPQPEPEARPLPDVGPVSQNLSLRRSNPQPEAVPKPPAARCVARA